MTAPEPAPREGRRLLFRITWNGLCERAEGFFYGIRPDGTLRWDIPADPAGWRWLRGQLGDWADRRNLAWAERHLRDGTVPREMWRRK